MRNTQRRQRIIDRAISNEDNTFCSTYIGQWRNKLIYTEFYGDTLVRCTGLPMFYTLDDNDKVEIIDGEKSFKVIDGLRRYNFRKGRLLFKEIQQVMKRFEGTPEFIEHELNNLMHFYQLASEPNHYADIKDLYMMLEQADRADLRIDVVTDCSHGSVHNYDNVYLRLIEKNVYTDDEEYWCTGGNTGCLPRRLTPSGFKSLMHDEILVHWKNAYGKMNEMSKLAEELSNDTCCLPGIKEDNSLALNLSHDLKSITSEIERLSHYASLHSELRLYLASDGCEFEYLSKEKIRDLFWDLAHMDNIFLPISYWMILMGQEQ